MSIPAGPSKFDVCVARVLDAEKGYKPASPDDPGGETNCGISKRAFPDVDIASLTPAGAIAIYRANHWATIRGDELPLFAAFRVLDFAVNSGPAVAVRTLQSVLGVDTDGVMGPKTLLALLAARPADLLATFAAGRLDFLASLPNWPANGRGWARRVAVNLRLGAIDLRT
jgi:lysozyme family protein